MEEKKQTPSEKQKDKKAADKEKLKKKKLNEEYRQKYFSFYDDIKTSDREDW